MKRCSTYLQIVSNDIAKLESSPSAARRKRASGMACSQGPCGDSERRTAWRVDERHLELDWRFVAHFVVDGELLLLLNLHCLAPENRHSIWSCIGCILPFDLRLQLLGELPLLLFLRAHGARGGAVQHDGSAAAG